MISYLTVKGQLVVDPFLGSGTFGKAALKLGRRFVGFEIDKDEYNKAKANLLGIARSSSMSQPSHPTPDLSPDDPIEVAKNAIQEKTRL